MSERKRNGPPHKPTEPVHYYRTELQECGLEDLETSLQRSVEGRARLTLYLGLWDGRDSMPSRFEESALLRIEGCLEQLVSYSVERVHLNGFDYLEPWLPLLRFLHSIAADRGFTDARGTHLYSKNLRKRYRDLLSRLLAARIPEIPKKESRAPANLFDDFVDIYARVLEIRRRVRARRQGTFPEADYRLLFPELADAFFKDLAHDDLASRQTRGRKLGQERIAVRILAYRHGRNENTISSWLAKARIRDNVAVSWGHLPPRRQRLRNLAKKFHPAS